MTVSEQQMRETLDAMLEAARERPHATAGGRMSMPIGRDFAE
jgi:hypothetical protein